MMNYLDEVAIHTNFISEETRADALKKGQAWFEGTDFKRSLDDGFKLWDAVSDLSEGVF